MNKKSIKILAIESSCDETSASLCEAKLKAKSSKLKDIDVNILSNIVSSQVKLHAKYGGVYPELASREHIRNIIPVIEQAISESNLNFKIPNFSALKLKIKNYIDYIAVTTGPGLVGSLLVGVETAKTLAYVFDKPIVPVNHLEGHIYANFVGEVTKNCGRLQRVTEGYIRKNATISNQMQPLVTSRNLPKFPILALVVSGGHTSLIYMKNHLNYKIIGETLDDAAGEAFDKVAAMLSLKYPGGPEIEAYASKISNKTPNPNVSKLNHLKFNKNLKLKIKNCFQFPRPMINSNDFNFSFAGLKTSVLYAIKKLPKPLSSDIKSIICKEFQDAVVDVLVSKTLRAAKKYKVKSILLGGGVTANSQLRKEFELRIMNYELYRINSNPKKLHVTRYTLQDFFVPKKSLCTDNATVIGAAAAYKILAGKISSWSKIKASANLEL